MTAVSNLLRSLRDLDRDRAVLLWTALAFAASGLLHTLVWLVDGGAWAGDVSWRKPIVFGFSGAITTASLAWALGAVRPSPARRRGVNIYVVAMALEIALITMQRWRGVASHFNTATWFDGIVFQLMGMLIIVASIPIVRWTLAVLRDRSLPAERRAVFGGGLALLVLGLVVGVVIAPLGSTGRMMQDADMIAAARGLVGAHAFALHGIQLMMGLSLVLPRFVGAAAARTVLLRAATWTAVAITLGLVAVGVTP